MTLTQAINGLMEFALTHNLIQSLDVPAVFNALLDTLSLDKLPGQDAGLSKGIPELPDTATPFLEAIIADAASRGLIPADASPGIRELWEARIMGLLTPSPSVVYGAFEARYAQESPEAATLAFYELCKANNYIRLDDIKRNERFFGDTPVGRLEITINLSKPEKTPEEIARLKSLPASDYPKCMLCKENMGYRGRLDHPARQNLRLIPVDLCGEEWYLQYSPYLYYQEHCIVLSGVHRDMGINRSAFDRLIAFVDKFPHYFIGSNADLPIVGGSILTHDHFQGGRHTFPMEMAKDAFPIEQTFAPEVALSLVDWPLTTLRLRAKDSRALADAAQRILETWRQYSDPACQIFSHTDTTPHNTLTPILRKRADQYEMDLTLRNNRTTSQHPRGIFHPHGDLHHIKQENIGLIEVMGVFILPGRLKKEMGDLEAYLMAEAPDISQVDEGSPLHKHLPWLEGLIRSSGTGHSREEAKEILRNGIAQVCARVLMDAGVYKRTPEGEAGVLRFMAAVDKGAQS